MRFVSYLLLTLSLLPAYVIADTVSIKLHNGDSLQGELLQKTPQSIKFSHSVLGVFDIATTDIKELVTISANNTADTSTVATNEQAQNNEMAELAAQSQWEKRFDLGVAGSAGKSRNRQINLGFTADLETEQTRVNSKSAYFRSESEGDLTDHAFYSTYNKDWLMPESDWFQFAAGRFDFDEFKDWDLRLAANGGLGYEFVNNDRWLFVGRSGGGFSQTFGGEREKFIPEGLLGLESRWHINQYQRVKFNNTLYASLSDMGEYRNLTSFDWILDLNTFAGVALKLGLLNEYDSSAEDVSKNDFRYTATLSWAL